MTEMLLGLSTPIKKYRNFDEASESILKMMSQFIEINTLFIAKNDKHKNVIVKVLNQELTLLEEGSELPFKETFCKLSVEKGREVLVISDLIGNDLAKDLDVTKKLGGGCFIGIPIFYENGENYGTICGLDTKPFAFTDKHVELFETMASLLSYVLELDNANKEIIHLSAPIVPITKGVAILPIIGDISEYRAEKIIHTALSTSTELSLQYLIIDLSGILQMNDDVSFHLLNLVQMLKLIGVTPALTGIRPDLAMKAVQLNLNLSNVMIGGNLEGILHRIGFTLNRNGS